MTYKKLKYWFDKDLAAELAGKIRTLYHPFNTTDFVQAVDTGVQELELKDRVETIADELFFYLGEDYETGLSILSQILGPENEEETGMFTNFYWVMPIAKYVEKYGLGHFKISMTALEEITKRNTSEYAIRPYLEQHTAKTLQRMMQWSTDNNFHLRRLASEGGRPRLPWATKLDMFIEDPSPLLPILENLKDDPSKYVQTSVANCINDILKDNPAIGRRLIEQWKKGKSSKERRWIIKHALRNLLKSDDAWASKMIS